MGRRRFTTVEVEMPVCPDCGERVEATICGAEARNQEAADALTAILLAAHRQLAHPKPAPADDTDRGATP